MHSGYGSQDVVIQHNHDIGLDDANIQKDHQVRGDHSRQQSRTLDVRGVHIALSYGLRHRINYHSVDSY